MPWLSILNGLLSLASALASFLHDKQLMDAGAAKAVSASLQEAMNVTKKALAARDAVSDDPDSVQHDKDNRDGK